MALRKPVVVVLGRVQQLQAADTLDPDSLPAALVYTSDARLSDARTPTAHHDTHETGGAVALADWSAVTGSPALLPLAVYYLDPSPGRLTASPPSEPGQLLQRVGVAVAPDTLDLDPFPDGILL